MKIYDISQEVFSCQVYHGDPTPEKNVLKSMEKGEVYNLTAFNTSPCPFKPVIHTRFLLANKKRISQRSALKADLMITTFQVLRHRKQGYSYVPILL